MIFYCQNPRQCTAGNVFSEDPYRGGDTWTCHKCHYANQIPHYCRKCWNAKTSVRRDIDWLKPGDKVCPSGHRIEPPFDRDYVESTLKRLSFEQMSAQYVQVDRAKSVPDTLSSQVRGGFCHGACLDWIRRVLLHGKHGFKDTPLENQQTITTHLHGSTSAAFEADKRVVQKFAQMHRNEEISTEQFQRVLNLPQYVRVWNTLSGNLDANIDDLRRDNNKSPSKRPFSHMKAVGGGDEWTESGGLKGLINALLKDIDFIPRRAAVLSVKPPHRPGASGHGIAIHKFNHYYFAFFDPNFGTYVYDKYMLRYVFFFLFKLAYPRLGAGSRDSKEYEVNGSVVGDYAIFDKR